MQTTSQFKTIFKDDRGCITALKQQRSKKWYYLTAHHCRESMCFQWKFWHRHTIPWYQFPYRVWNFSNIRTFSVDEVITSPIGYQWQCILQFLDFKMVAVHHLRFLKFEICQAHRVQANVHQKTILALVEAYLDHSRRARGDVYRCAKFSVHTTALVTGDGQHCSARSETSGFCWRNYP